MLATDVIVQGMAVMEPGKPLEPFEYELGALEATEVEIDVHSCGLCHSDLSMIDNAWEVSEYPLVPGHEVIGVVAAVGERVQSVQVGQRVGLGWTAGSCKHCQQCMGGDHNLCAKIEQTLVRRPGGFANKVRCREEWAIPLPASLNPRTAGPLLCGGITVFNPIVQYGVKATDRVAVIGVGGLGHLALQFLNKWGCEVTAFTSSKEKKEQLLEFGAHRVLSTHDAAVEEEYTRYFDFILSTVNVPLEWNHYLRMLQPKGKLVTVGVVLEDMPVDAVALITGQRSVAGSNLGSPHTYKMMMDFCARHQIEPMVEFFPMSRVNEALAHLKAGKARYRIVLENDFASRSSC